ncbi:MAG: von Willebrand factor type A domain-containing protein [Verrucomicrobiales bacterium]|nr:von Willebrand factor type A domain-containing protein [Verrucomicrobiales bacterium]
MNPEPPNLPTSDPEVRLTALLLGELPPDEAAAVQQDLTRNPELARLHARLAQTIGLVRDAAHGAAARVPVPASEPKLAPELRDSLLAKLKTVVLPAVAPRPRTRHRPGFWLAAAAGVAVLLFLSAGLLLPSFAKAKAKSQSLRVARAPLIETLGEVQFDSGQQEEAEGGIRRRDTASARPERLGRTSLAAAPADKPVPERVVNGPTANGRSPDAGAAPAMDVRMLMRYGLMPKDAKAAPAGEAAPPASARAAGRPATPPPPALARRFAEPSPSAATPAPADGAGFQPAREVAGKALAQVAPTQPVTGQQPAPAANALQNWSFAVRGQTEAAREITDFDNDGAVDRFTAGYAFQPPAAATPQAAGAVRGSPVTSLNADHASRGGVAAGAFGGFGGAGGFGGGGLGGDNFGRANVVVPEAEQLGVLAKATSSGLVARGDSSARGYYANNGLGTFTLTNRATPAPGWAEEGILGQLALTTERLERNLILGTRLVPAGRSRRRNARAYRVALATEQARTESIRRDSTAIAERKLSEALAPATVPASEARPIATTETSPPVFVAAMEAPVSFAVQVPQATASVPVLGDTPALGRLFTTSLGTEKFDVALRNESRAKIAEFDRSRGLALNAEARQRLDELEPLPLKLPVPAFMGTPTDLPLGVSPATPAAKPEAAQPQPDALGSAGLAPAQGVRRAGAAEITTPSAGDLFFSLADAETDQKERFEEGRALELATKGIALLDDSAPVTSTDLDSLERVEQAAPTPPPTVPAEPAPPAEPQPEVFTADNPFSTFSLNVTDVAFKLAAASLEAGQLPAPASIRVEEFVNAFDYRDPEPAPGAPLAFHWERARYPFAHNRDVLRFSVQTAALGREPGRPLNLVLLLDNSGSMERADRVTILREALHVLAGQLAPQDQISVVAFARTARLWVDALPGSQAAELLDRVGNLTPEGGTNLEDALKVGYETALRHFLPHGVNRVILLTDGAANLGAVEPDVLKAMVAELRRRGVALDCFGIGWEGYNDDLLEVLSRHGDGRYGFVNTPEEAATGFADQLAGALQVAAADVKVQVEFNPARVASWRQIGYAKHQLTKEQFRDNTVDAAEIGAAESGNALYVIETNPRGQGALGILRVRYRVPTTGQVHELEWPLEYRGPAPDLAQASPTLRLATAAAAFGEMLATSPFAAEVSSDRLLPLLRGVAAAFHPDPRPAQLEAMIQQARALGGR